MIEVGINQRWEEGGQTFTRMVGGFYIEDNGTVVVTQPIDGQTLAAVLPVLQGMAVEQHAALAALAPEG